MLFLKYYWRSADTFSCEVDGDLDTVSDLDERNAAIHPNSLRSNAIVPLIEPSPVPLPVMVKLSFSGLVTPQIDVPFGKAYPALICIFLGRGIAGNK